MMARIYFKNVALFLLVTVLPCLEVSAATAVAVVDVNGRTHVGMLQAFSDSSVVIQGENVVEISTSDLLQIRFNGKKRPKIPNGAVILLENGDRIVARPLKIENEQLTAAWRGFPAWRPLSIPLETIRGVIFRMPLSRTARKKGRHFLLDRRYNDDVLILNNGDSLTGEFLNLTADRISIKTAAGEIAVPRSGVRILGFNPKLISFPVVSGLRAVMTLADGSHITVQNLKLKPNGLLDMVTLFGDQLEIPLSDIEALQFLGGRAEYLSDLEPAEYRFTPYLSQQWKIHRDKNVVGGPLRVRGSEFVKGLGTHSQSEITYKLDGKYQQFQTVIGIDDETGGKGSVVFAIELDGKRVYTSDELTGKSPAVTVDAIDISGAKALTLIVEFGEFGDVLDHANWCNALLVKK